MASRVVVPKLEEERQARRMNGLNNPREIEKILSKRPISQAALKDLKMHQSSIMSDDPRQQFESTQYFRKLLSAERNPPIQQVIDAGVVPRLVQFLSCFNNSPLQFEACWALTNIASGTSNHTQLVLKHGAVPLLIALLFSPNEEVIEQAIWALGNISGDSCQCRDFILGLGVIDPLIQAVKQAKSTSLIRNATWAISNLCRGKPQPLLKYQLSFLPILSQLIYNEDEEILADCLWAFGYITSNSGGIQPVLEAGVVSRIVKLCAARALSVKTPAVRTLGNIVTGSDHQTQRMLDAGALPVLGMLLDSTRKSLCKEALWALSNIFAGSQSQIQSAIEAQVIPKIIQCMHSSDIDICKEACWAISNATSGGTADQIKHCVDWGCIPPMCKLLHAKDNRIVTVAIEGLTNIAHFFPESIPLIRDVPEQMVAIQAARSSLGVTVDKLMKFLQQGAVSSENDHMETEFGG